MLNNEAINQKIDHALSLIATRIDIPDGYTQKSCLLLSHDNLPVLVFRYEKENGENNGLGGEHFSISVDLNATKIMGIMHIAAEQCGEGLPNDDEAQKIAESFLTKVAPDLQGKYEVKWILSQKEQPEKIPHELPFPLTDDEGQAYLVTGVRVKLFFPELESWGWVIVGRNQNIISFEREVIWNTIMHRRSTPAWLHDNYIEELMSDLEKL